MYFKGSKPWLKVLSLVAFAVYLAVLLRLTVVRDGLFDGEIGEGRSVNLKLWAMYDYLLSTGQVIQYRYLLAGNFLCLAPLGFACGFFRKNSSVLFAASVSLGATLFIELWQLAFNVGYFELDDIILNLLGGVFGYAAHRLAVTAVKAATERKHGKE